MYRNTLTLNPVEKFLTGLLAIVLMIAGFFAGLVALGIASVVVLFFLARIAWDRHMLRGRIQRNSGRHGKNYIDGKYRIIRE